MKTYERSEESVSDEDSLGHRDEIAGHITAPDFKGLVVVVSFDRKVEGGQMMRCQLDGAKLSPQEQLMVCATLATSLSDYLHKATERCVGRMELGKTLEAVFGAKKGCECCEDQEADEVWDSKK